MINPGFAAIVIGVTISTLLYYMFSATSSQDPHCNYSNPHASTRTRAPRYDTFHGARPYDDTLDNYNCTICLNPIRSTEEQKSCPFLHVFHRTCLQKWMQQGPLGSRHSCPVCRHPIN